MDAESAKASRFNADMLRKAATSQMRRAPGAGGDSNKIASAMTCSWPSSLSASALSASREARRKGDRHRWN